MTKMNIQHINYIDNVCVFVFHFYVNALVINWIYSLSIDYGNYGTIELWAIVHPW